MSILTKVEVKGWRGRLFLTGVTLALIVGGTTMLYPFLLMVSGAMRSDMDAGEMTLVPRFLVNNDDLVRKFIESKYNYNPILMNRYRQVQEFNFATAAVPQRYLRQEVDDFRDYLESRRPPIHWQSLGGTLLHESIISDTLEDLVKTIRGHFNNDLEAYNEEIGSPLREWWMISMAMRNWESPRSVMPQASLHRAYVETMLKRDPAYRAFVNLSSYFIERMVIGTYGANGIDRFNQKVGLALESYDDFCISQRVPPPENEVYRTLWLSYIFDGHVNLSFVRSDASDEDFRGFVQQHFGTVERMRRFWYDTSFEDFEDVVLPGDHEWLIESKREVYRNFLRSLPPESLRLVGPEFEWRQYLQDKYQDPAAAALAHGKEFDRWEAVQMPVAELESSYVLDNKAALRRHYAFRNFRIVSRQMFVQGRSFFNSVIYVALALLFALTLQPLVAYSLSRFHPRGTWKIIFIFIATMAFPPMVAMIPQFLVIKKLGLLNTFFALVLPVSVNGMLIFLLKGFFDSIPRDLYDAAVIDGASEFRIFWQITMSMSRPILAVVALQTFTAAWNSFLYPLIVCPDEKMHVIAVWLQQFQQEASGSAVFASIIVASIPSLLIFVFAQRTIMRGIAVPSEK